ncbi:leucine-rich repeat and immunoglobulin-like domain-containing nogo receptor-interacting protein 3 [Limulus polyphemus]|uniref:Leucine-rich repeat and immunoglobulin-like domain-containing nogo receptor-interacting protein 3 n=1 Tax=Limulus polyphemus TaxID=6850 RepID=A0ABM1BXR6_LIMPO|nr:leucine-rich repeat and immunoglobulin-like domain-containing nogo receptor-interacting protein 3 [Limulus polyphemus]XP_022258582.1 leucine-rich repeat and immunoglobulin-like domain-containing nogo receptor-interacting protein 3 [Limulus polyphemus]
MLRKIQNWSLLMTIVTSLLLGVSVEAKCPPPENIYPCSCSENIDTCFYSCRGLDNNSSFLVYEQFRSCPKVRFSITSGEMSFLPHRFFGKFGSVESFSLYLVRLKLEYLGETSSGLSAFDGLSVKNEFSVYMQWTDLGSSFDWSAFSAVDFGPEVSTTFISNISEFSELSPGFYTAFSGSNMNSLVVSVAGLVTLADVPLGQFSSLVNVNFERNSLTEIKRSNFPRPAPELENIDLNRNQISFLPEDLFTDMFKLKSVDISINQISVLTEETFKPIFTSLDRLIVIGLPFTCDCRLAWMIPHWKEKVIDASGMARTVTCKEPPNLAGRRVPDLQAEDLTC